MKNKKIIKGGAGEIDVDKFVEFHFNYLKIRLEKNNITLNNSYISFFEEKIHKYIEIIEDSINQRILLQPLYTNDIVSNIHKIFDRIIENAISFNIKYFTKEEIKKFLNDILINKSIIHDIKNEQIILKEKTKNDIIDNFMYLFALNIIHLKQFIIKDDESYSNIINLFINHIKNYITNNLINSIVKFKAEKFASFYLEYLENNKKEYIDIENIFVNSLKYMYKKYNDIFNKFMNGEYNKYKKNNYRDLALLLKECNHKFNYYNFGSEIYLLNFFRDINTDIDFVHCQNLIHFITEFKKEDDIIKASDVKYTIQDYFYKIAIDILIYLYIFNYYIYILHSEIINIEPYFIECFKNELEKLQRPDIKEKINKKYEEFISDENNKEILLIFNKNPKNKSHLYQFKYNIYKYEPITYNTGNCSNILELFNQKQMTLYLYTNIIRLDIPEYKTKSSLKVKSASLENRKISSLNVSSKKVKSLDNKKKELREDFDIFLNDRKKSIETKKLINQEHLPIQKSASFVSEKSFDPEEELNVKKSASFVSENSFDPEEEEARKTRINILLQQARKKKLEKVSSQRKISSQKKVKSLNNKEKELHEDFDNFIKGINEKKSVVSEEEHNTRKEKELHNDFLNIIINNLLEDKLSRLIYYLRKKKNNINFRLYNLFYENIISIILVSYLETIKYLRENEYSINNIEKIAYYINYFNNINKINYYNYGSEAYLLLLLKSNIKLKDINTYIEQIKNNNKEKDKDIKYTFKNYLNKIGYDLAIYIYYYYLDYIIKYQELYEMVENNIIRAEDTINDNFMLEVENKYKEVKRKNKEIETIFNNPLYKDEPEQLKYNLYKYGYNEYKEENEKKWFLNNAILRLSDI